MVNWNDLSRLAILNADLLMLNLMENVALSSNVFIASFDDSLMRLERIFHAVVAVISRKGLKQHVASKDGDVNAEMLGCAVGIVTVIVRIIENSQHGFTTNTAMDLFASECIYEILLTKAVQLLQVMFPNKVSVFSVYLIGFVVLQTFDY